MVQTLWVKDQLEKNIPNLEVSVEAMATQGDKILDVALQRSEIKDYLLKNLKHKCSQESRHCSALSKRSSN